MILIPPHSAPTSFSELNSEFRKSLVKQVISSALLSAAVAVAACAPDPKIELPPTGNAHIVNGERVGTNSSSKKEPLAQNVVALVAVQNGEEALCTGTILSDSLILTAAHCVEGRPEKMIIAFSPTLNTKKAGLNPDLMREANRFAQHPLWVAQQSSGRGDLALVHFEGGLPGGYKPVQLASPRFKLEPGEEVHVIGYGVTNGLSHKGSGLLRETQTSVLSALSPTEIITDGKTSGVCFGDSGGPAFSVSNGQWVQWGVASSVTSPACNDSSIHTAIMNYLPWIQETSARLDRR